jgi:hypothetical protein
MAKMGTSSGAKSKTNTNSRARAATKRRASAKTKTTAKPRASAKAKSTEKKPEASAKASKSIAKIPPGWILSGDSPTDYEAGIDFAVTHKGSRSAYMTNKVAKPSGFGTLMQQFAPDRYLKSKIKLRMWVKTEKVKGSALPWLRVDGPKGHNNSLGFDNCCNRPLKGTADWTKYELVLEVPKDSTNIAFGIVLYGTGKLWIEGLTIEEAHRSDKTTDCPCYKQAQRSKPRNLNFEED